MGSGERLRHGGSAYPADSADHRGAAVGGKALKATTVTANNRRRAFEVELSDGRTLPLPYARLERPPTAANRVAEVYSDPELGHEGFTYVLTDGTEESVPVDAVLDYNRDPGYVRDMLAYHLTLEARRRMETTRLSRREIIRRLGTSPSQLYRLLDPAHQGKTIDRLVELLAVLGCGVRLEVRPMP
jgi:predicted XRE-type DNA-binding protein